MQENGFGGYHPAVVAVYFLLVFLGTMVLTHPVCQLLSLVAGVWLLALLEGKQGLGAFLRLASGLFFLTALINPAFSHEGVTILCYLPSQNPLTLESMVYGLGAGVLFVSILGWFSSFRRLMTAEKWMYLLGRPLPVLSLVLAMAMRFVPLFQKEAKEIARAQRGIGRDASQGSLFHRAKCAVRMTSILLTWALEKAVDTADSMKGRGYGLPNRTAFSLYRWQRRDGVAAWYLGLLTGLLAVCAKAGAFSFRYYPSIQGVGVSLWSVTGWVCYGALLLLPHMIWYQEQWAWKKRKAAYHETNRI